MKTAGKILGIILVLFLALMAAGAAYLIWIFDPNDYKPKLTALVERHTGRRLHIDGEIHLVLFPDLGIKTGRIWLDDVAGFGKGPFAELQSVAVRVKMTPLLSGQVVIERISLDGLRLHLIKDKNGKTNWADLIQTIANTGRSEPAPDGTGAKKWVTGVPVLSLHLEDAHIIFVDRAASNRLEISDFDLSSGALGGGEPVAVQAEFQGKLRQPALEGTAEFSGQVVTDLDHRRYALGDTELTFKLTGPDLPPTGLQGKLAVAAEVDIPEGLATVSTLILEILPLRIEGEFMARAIAEAPVFEGKLAVKEFSPREVFDALGKPPPKSQDETVLTEAASDLTLMGNAKEINIQPVEGYFDDTQLSGRITVKNPTDPAIRFDLELDELNLDRYRPPEADPTTAPDPATVAAGPPLETLRGLNLRGNLRIGKLTMNDQSTENVVIRVQWDPE